MKNKMAGYDWIYSFLKRLPTLSVLKARGPSCALSKGLNKEDEGKFFRYKWKVVATQVVERAWQNFNCR
jgi:hypothetical protein